MPFGSIFCCVYVFIFQKVCLPFVVKHHALLYTAEYMAVISYVGQHSVVNSKHTEHFEIKPSGCPVQNEYK